MTFRIHFTVNGSEDYIDLEGDSVKDIRAKWDGYADGKPVKDMWSEEI